MKSLLLLTTKELRTQVLTPRVYVMLLVSVLLLSFGIWAGYSEYSLCIAERSVEISEYEDHLADAESQDILTGSFHLKGFSPVSKLQIWLGRFYDGIPRAVQFEKEGYVSQAGAQVAIATSAVSSQIDFVSIIVMIYSLIAVLMGFNAVVGEREEGTLKLLVAGGIPRYKIVAAKLLAGYSLLILPVSIAVLGNLVVLQIMDGGLLVGEDGVRLVLMFLTTALFLATCFAGTVFVSTRCRDSQTSLLVGLLAWIILIFVYPGTAELTSDLFLPGQSLSSQRAEKMAVLRGLEREKDLKISDLYAATGSYANYDEMANLNIAFRGEEVRINDNILQDAHRRVVRRRTFGFWMSSLSPMAVYEGIVQPLCNSGAIMQEHFHSRMMVYKDQLQSQYFKDFSMQKIHTPDGRMLGGGVASSPLTPADIKGFDPGFPTLRDILPVIIPRLVILFVMLIISVCASFVAFLRYDVR